MSMQQLIEHFFGPQPGPDFLPEPIDYGLPALLELKLEDARERQYAERRRMAPGTLVEGRVVKRRYGGVDVEMGHGEIVPLRSASFMRAARRACQDGCLPDVDETVQLSFHGLERNGTPHLYAWNLEADPKYLDWAAGYRARYRGEDGPFATLPWERADIGIEPYDYRRNRP